MGQTEAIKFLFPPIAIAQCCNAYLRSNPTNCFSSESSVLYLTSSLRIPSPSSLCLPFSLVLLVLLTFLVILVFLVFLVLLVLLVCLVLLVLPVLLVGLVLLVFLVLLVLLYSLCSSCSLCSASPCFLMCTYSLPSLFTSSTSYSRSSPRSSPKFSSSISSTTADRLFFYFCMLKPLTVVD